MLKQKIKFFITNLIKKIVSHSTSLESSVCATPVRFVTSIKREFEKLSCPHNKCFFSIEIKT